MDISSSWWSSSATAVPKTPKTPRVRSHRKQRKVLVVGSGPCGLVALKEMVDAGHDATLVEAGSDLAPPPFAAAGRYLTTSNYFAAFSDFPPNQRIKYWSAPEYAAYLRAYVEANDLLRRVEFNTKVRRARFVNDEWVVDLATSSVWVESTRRYDALCVATKGDDAPSPLLTTTTSRRRRPEKKNPRFKGTQLHSEDLDFETKFFSHELRWSKQFKGKNVLVVVDEDDGGDAANAADVAPEIAASGAKSVTVWCRRTPAFVSRFPTLLFSNDDSFDEDALLRGLGSGSGGASSSSLKADLPDFLEYSTISRCRREASVGLAGLNDHAFFGHLEHNGRPAARLAASLLRAAAKRGKAYYAFDEASQVARNGFRVLKAILRKDLRLVVAADANFDAAGVRFSRVSRLDATEFSVLTTHQLPNLDVVVWCSSGDDTNLDWIRRDEKEDEKEQQQKRLLAEKNTAHYYDKNKNGSSSSSSLFSLRREEEKGKKKTLFEKKNPRSWYKHCFPPPFDGRLGFYGWAEPRQGGTAQCAELLARYHALLLSGDRRLPEDYAERAREEGDAERAYYANSPESATLVDYPSFCDSVATLIGCKPEPPFRRPVRLLQYWLYPIWGYWYRTRGPGARADVLDAVLERFPLRQRGLASAEGTGTWLFGMHPLAVVAVALALIQRLITVVVMLLPLSSLRRPGCDTPLWQFLKPKHFVLHGNDISWKNTVVA